MHSTAVFGASGTDSLKVVLSTTNEDSTLSRIKLLKAIVVEYIYTNLDSAEVYGVRLLHDSESSGDLLSVAKAYNSLADIYNLRGEYDKALEMMEQSLIVCNSLGSLKGLTVNKFLKGNILQNIHRYSAADSAYQQSLELARSNGDSVMVANNYLNLGINNDQLGLYEKAFHYYFGAIERFERQGNKRGVAQVYSNLISIFSALGQEEKSIDYAQRAIAIKKEIGSYGILPTSYQNLSNTYAQIGETEKALSSLDSAFHFAAIANTDSFLPYLYFTKAEQLSKLNRAEEALAAHHQGLDFAQKLQDSFQIVLGFRGVGRILTQQKKYAEAEPYLRSAVSYSHSIKNNKMEMGSLESLFDALTRLGKYQEATLLHDRIRVVRDSLFSDQKILVLNELETKYRTEKAITANRLLQVEKETQALIIRRQRSRMWMFALAAAALGIIAFILYRRSQERKRLNERLQTQKERIELLHKELNHRVKNNLAFIAGLMRMQRRRLNGQEARQAVRQGESRVEAMSLLHRKFYLGGNDNSTDIGDYLEELCGYLVSTYPKLEHLPRINLEITPCKANDEAASCIGLIINELVTNSFKHAFSSQEQPVINIGLSYSPSPGYQLTYTDNGSGIPLDINISETTSLGMKLIYILTRQLEGKLSLERNSGTHFNFYFTKERIVA